MRLLNVLRLLVDPAPPVTGVAQGACFYDSTANEPYFFDGSTWVSFSGGLGFPDPNTATVTIPDARQVLYFDNFVNNGVLNIVGTGVLAVVR